MCISCKCLSIKFYVNTNIEDEYIQHYLSMCVSVLSIWVITESDWDSSINSKQTITDFIIQTE